MVPVPCPATAPVPPPSYQRTVAKRTPALHIDAVTLITRLHLLALCQLAVTPARPRCPARPCSRPPSYALPAWVPPPYAPLPRLGLARVLSLGSGQPARWPLCVPPPGDGRGPLPSAPPRDPPRCRLLGQRPDCVDPWRPGRRRRHPL